MENYGLYLLILLIPFLAQIYVSYTYKKYSKIYSNKKNTGYDIAKKILNHNDLKNMYVVETKGVMSDHYDSSRKTVRLSTNVYKTNSIASVAIAAHEVGHAIQDKEDYLLMRIRSFIFPIVSFGTKIAYLVLFIGLVLSSLNLVYLAIILVSLGLLFQLVTLPLEFNASKRAKEGIIKYNLVDEEELNGVKKMLNAAALTYVAGVLSSALEILRLVLMFTKDND